jgi:hypothetical protein
MVNQIIGGGSGKMGETVGMEETAVLYYFMFAHPNLINEDARKSIPPEVFEEFNSVRKRDFLKLFSIAWRRDHVKRTFIFDSQAISSWL